MSGIVRGVGVLAAGMAAGTSLVWGRGLSAASSVAMGPFLDVHGDVWDTWASLTAMLDGTALLIAILAAVGLREKRRVMPGAGLAAVGLMVALVLGMLLIEPMSAELARWTGTSAPTDAGARIRLITQLLMARAALEGLAGVGLIMALVLDRPVRRSYTSLRPEVNEAAYTVLVPGR